MSIVTIVAEFGTWLLFVGSLFRDILVAACPNAMQATVVQGAGGYVGAGRDRFGACKSAQIYTLEASDNVTHQA